LQYGIAYIEIGGGHEELPIADGALEPAVDDSRSQPEAMEDPVMEAHRQIGIEKFFQDVNIILPVSLEGRDAAAVSARAVDKLTPGVLGLEQAEIDLEVPPVTGVGPQVSGGQVVGPGTLLSVYGVLCRLLPAEVEPIGEGEPKT
jgi:hypothetical protein